MLNHSMTRKCFLLTDIQETTTIIKAFYIIQGFNRIDDRHDGFISEYQRHLM